MKNSGIYIIRNKINNDCYIGSSSDIKKRFSRHKRELKSNKHHSIILQRAYNKYTNFTFEILFNCNKKVLLKYEQYFINKLKPKYNIAKHVKAPMSGRKHSEETKKKMSKVHKGNKYNLGRKHTIQQRNDRSKMRKGFKHSEETKKKMSETAKRVNSISRIDREKAKIKVKDNLHNKFNSLAEASLFHKISVQTVCDILKGRHYKTRKGVVFYYDL